MMRSLKRLALAALFALAFTAPAFATDVSITAANVVAGANAITQQGVAGATITAGQFVYLDSATSTYKLCVANGTALTSACVGVALHGASASQPLVVQTKGSITIGGTLVNGTTYWSSVSNPGGITATAPTTGGFPEVLGIASSTTVLLLDFIRTGVVI